MVVIFVCLSRIVCRAVAVASAHHEHHHDRACQHDGQQQNRRDFDAKGDSSDRNGGHSKRIPRKMPRLHGKSPSKSRDGVHVAAIGQTAPMGQSLNRD